MSATTGFRRLVLELGHGSVDAAMIGRAAAFARLMGAELHALFVEDENLLRVSALPFAREISSLSLQWRSLSLDRLETELRAAADQARRRFVAIADAAGVRQTFEVRRGDLAQSIDQLCVASDIVVVTSSRREITFGQERLRDTVRRSAASVLFLPRDGGRRDGSIIALVTDDDDPSLVVARRIATQEGERLIVLRPASSASVQDIAAAIGARRERLIVMKSGGTERFAPDLAAARGVAVLVVEPRDAG